VFVIQAANRRPQNLCQNSVIRGRLRQSRAAGDVDGSYRFTPSRSVWNRWPAGAQLDSRVRSRGTQMPSTSWSVVTTRPAWTVSMPRTARCLGPPRWASPASETTSRGPKTLMFETKHHSRSCCSLWSRFRPSPP